MQWLTTVDEYVLAALKRAQGRALEEGGFEAWVPDCPGVMASGDDSHECMTDLIIRLFDWVKVGLENGFQLPVLNGIDLNTDPNQVLATYYRPEMSPVRGEFYATEEELEAAFARHDKAD